MTREQLEHLIRAASVIADDDTIVIIGSQAILGQFPDAPESMREPPRRDPKGLFQRSSGLIPDLLKLLIQDSAASFMPHRH